MRSEISFCRPDKSEIEIDCKAALRFMGVKRNASCETLEKSVLKIASDLNRVVCYQACYAPVSIAVSGSGRVNIDCIAVDSRDLSRCLAGCTRAFLFAATTGIGVDRFIAKLGVRSAAEGLIADAVGSAAIESFCDFLNIRLASGRKCRPRFSPGYGDLKIEHQKDFTNYLECSRNIGLSLTDSLIMTPVKSVTAIIGIEDEQ